MARHGLGKGLDALLAPGDDQETSGQPEAGFRQLPLDRIAANPEQPRRVFDEGALEELAASIREHGIIQPVVLERDGRGGYIIVAGERRCRAARMAGLTEVPAVVREYGEERRLEVALVENVQRSDLNPVEEARAYRKLMEITGLSQDGVAERVGKSRPTVANALRLLKLPEDMLDALADGRLTSGHARAILSVASEPARQELFGRTLQEGLSVREAERIAGDLNAPGGSGEGRASGAGQAKKPDTRRPPELAEMEQKFIDLLGTKVSITGDLKRGTIRVDYYSMDDLDRLYGVIAPK